MKTLNQVIIIFAALVLYGNALAEPVPHLINYQGKLTGADGSPLATADYTLSFKIYNQASSGTAVWGPQNFPNVPVAQGYFNVILGPLDTGGKSIVDAFATANAYLEIMVNNGSPILPRQRVLSAPYAVHAEKSDYSNYAEKSGYSDMAKSVEGFGKVLQVVHAQTNEFIAGSTTIPWDDSIPQISEGVSIITLNIQPNNSNSKLLIEATVHATEQSNTSNHIIVAIFENSKSNAIATAVEDSVGDGSYANGMITTIPLSFMTTSNTLMPITFELRAGIDGGTININGGNTSRKLGGTLFSTLTVTEISN